MDSINEKIGNVFCIPLFLPETIKDNRKNYSRIKFDSTDQYAFGRLIEIDKSAGDLVEIFTYTGPIPNSVDVILNSGRLLDPLRVTLGFEKKRWRFMFLCQDFDAIRDANYNEIAFVMGDRDDPVLWKGGTKSSISVEEAVKYNRWIIQPPTKVESMIREKIKV